jgi:predicted transposase/invertase (TIGR01784 family)
MIDHDRLFKELLSTFFVEFLELFFPDVSEYVERDSLVPIDKELFTDVTSGERYEADLVMRAQFRGQSSQFLVHVEHQSSSQSDFNRRMFRYFARLHETHALPVYPIVIFSHDSPRRPEPDSYRVEFSDFLVLEFHYRVIQLNRLQWQDFVNQPNPVASALMAKMQMEPQERPVVKVECLRLLASLGLNPAQIQLISGFIDTYLKLSQTEQARFQAELDRIEPARQEEVMQIVTSWMEEGLERGREEGRRLEALALVLRLLARRVGEVEPELQEQIQALAIAQIEDLGEALLDFSTKADLDAWLEDCVSRLESSSDSPDSE